MVDCSSVVSSSPIPNYNTEEKPPVTEVKTMKKKKDRSENWSDSTVIEQQQQHIGSSSPIRNDTPIEEKPVTVVKKTKKKKDRNENWNDSIATEQQQQQQHIGSSFSSPRTKRRKKSEPGVQVIRGSRIYDSENGKSCHQCRQKTLDFVATCTNHSEKKHCTLNVCHKCLFNRYGEKAEEAVALGNWKCPKCRGICNCSVCMKKRGMQPTGILVHSARSNGFSSVSEMLYGKGSESSGALPKKVDAPNETTAVASSGECDEGSGCDGKSDSISQRQLLGKKKETRNGKLKKSEDCEKVEVQDKISPIEIPPQPQGTALNIVAATDVPAEDVGHALQFLEFCEAFGKSIENTSALEELFPPRGGPNFKYSVEDGREKTEQDALSLELSNMVKGKQTSREVISWVEDSVYPVHGFEVTLKVVVQTLLDIGSKSFTHLITVLERYGQVIAKVCPDQDKQVMLIDEVNSFWKNSSQMAAIALDRMMGYRLISNLAIVEWVFSPSNIEQFHTADRSWEILRNAVSKTYNRICDLRKEISFLKKGVKTAEEAAARAKAELDAAESKLTLVDGEPVLGENPIRMRRLKLHAEKSKEEEVSLRDSLEAKEALLARALDENEAVFISLFKSFGTVLMECLPVPYRGTLRGLKSIQTDTMAIDPEETSQMEVDNEPGTPKKGQANGVTESTGYNIGEKEQWCLSTLGHVKAFSRQYASEVGSIGEEVQDHLRRWLLQECSCIQG